MCSVGLPRPNIVRGSEVNRVLLAIAAHGNPHPSVGGCVKGRARARQVERRLDEAAIIFQSHVSRHAQTRATIHHVVKDQPLGDATHHSVADATPPRPQL